MKNVVVAILAGIVGLGMALVLLALAAAMYGLSWRLGKFMWDNTLALWV